VQLLGPGGQQVLIDSIKDCGVYRVDKEKLVRLDKDPLWLKNFEGRDVNESIGSLVAKVDGRNVPLTVGYHKVSVDIRDQIARTVVEESFVNTTGGRLEGVFYFPLPQDASISGFGMWIGDELVEADVVEKQRAREIFEEILRQRRDPGLLEWSGGNMFKARVFPIEAHSEKRIQISYTQVLPMKGGGYRYTYALQSEMLKQHPLRELQIDLKLNSALPLKAVTCPTHAARMDRTANSAHVEFAAQEYTPTRDFEVAVDVDAGQSDVVLIPHRRGDDGYFMLMLAAPGDGAAGKARMGASPAAASWTPVAREILPDAAADGPQDLLILADTSASMDAGQRNMQGEFIAALAGALGTKDTFNLACCDVDCYWVCDKPVLADARNVAAARDFLAKRASLGWSDLDKAFASAMGRCGPRTRVVYVGGGIVTTGDGDPVAFAKRLRLLYQGRNLTNTFHAVSVGSTSESGVLKAIASLGGGSVRQITAPVGEKGPRAIAMELLDEMARPPLRDLKVEFRGLATARVYPEELPNLAAGSQQILLGRYLPKDMPQGADQTGEVIITGLRGGQPVRYSSRVSLKDAEYGNSFIPRLWARMHLDFLLSQGTSQATKDEIIALSQEYHIMTPYTSLLVLESDADRERFKVARHFQMRDGEKFFAQGPDNADYELTQQQMMQAGAWRLGLRRAVLRQLSGLGRDSLPLGIQRDGPVYDRGGSIVDVDSIDIGSLTNVRTMPVRGSRTSLPGGSYGTNVYDIRDLIISVPNFGGARIDPSGATLGFRGGDQSVFGTGSSGGTSVFGTGQQSSGGQEKSKTEIIKDITDVIESRDRKEDADSPQATGEPMTEGLDAPDARDGDLPGPRIDLSVFGTGGRSYSTPPDWLSEHRKLGPAVAEAWLEGSGPNGGSMGLSSGPSVFGSGEEPTQWLDTLFPSSSLPGNEPLPDEQAQGHRWPAEARAISDSLLRRPVLATLKGGLVVEQQDDTFDPQTGQLDKRNQSLQMVSPTAWLIRRANNGEQTTVQWCDAKGRGIFNKGFMLGRTYPAAAGDLANPPLDFGSYLWESLEKAYQDYAVEIKPQALGAPDGGEGKMLLTLTAPDDPDSQIRILVDTVRHVVLSVQECGDGKVTRTSKYNDFVEVAGAWWATRFEVFDDKGRSIEKTTYKFTAPGAQEFDKQFQAELADKPKVQFLCEPGKSLSEAKRAAALGKADFDDHMTLLLDFARSQQWAKVMERLDAAQKLAAMPAGGAPVAPTKPGMRWVRDAVLQVARGHEELKNRLLARAAELAKTAAPSREDLPLAQYMLDCAAGLFEDNETLSLMDALKPVFVRADARMGERQPAHLHGMTLWNSRRVDLLQKVGRNDEALALTRQMATDNPSDCSLQLRYAQALAAGGQIPDAYAWIEQSLAEKPAGTKWSPGDEESLRARYADMLGNEGRYDDLVTYTSKWMQRELDGTAAYERHLGALVRADHADEANKLIEQWLLVGQAFGPVAAQPGKAVPPNCPAVGRLTAAVSRALGDQDRWSSSRWIEERWLGPLADTALALAKDPFHADIAERIMNDQQFQKSDECRRVRKAAIVMLAGEIDKLTPEVVGRLVEWTMVGDPAVAPAVWKGIAADLHKRWSAAAKPQDRYALGQTLMQIYASQIYAGRPDAEDQIAFLREEVKDGPADYRTQYAAQLLELLTRQPWQQSYEDEALALIDKLSDMREAWQRLDSAVAALHVVDDRMVQARLAVKTAAVAHPEQLPRTQLKALQAQNLRLARSEFAQRLAREAATRSGPIVAWLNAERARLDVLSGGNLEQAAGTCWEILGAEPKKLDLDAHPELTLDRVLQNRMSVMVTNLACRRSAQPALVERVTKFIDQGIEMDKESQRWKLLKYEMLVAMDKPKELEAALAGWTVDQDPDNRWRISLGYLLAEQGKLAQAIKLFEAVAALDELGPADYRSLADWYMTVNRRDQYRDAMNAVYRLTSEGDLSNALYYRMSPSDGGAATFGTGGSDTPVEVDEQVLAMFAAMFEKANSPQEYMGLLREYYVATRDLGLLSGLADAMVGQTAGKVYPLLADMESVLAEIHDEATLDSIADGLAKVRRRATTDTDRRALDLLEVMVERKAAGMLDQPGPHTDKALAALKRAFKRAWSPGEQRLMADLLSSMTNVGFKPLADEQLRQLEALHRDAARGSADRLHIAVCVANAYTFNLRDDDATDLLEAALEEFGEANSGVLPVSANDALDTLVGYCKNRNHFARGEKILLEQLKHPVNEQQKFWLALKLYDLYGSAVLDDGEVSLGKGAVLYKAVEQKIIADLATPDQDRRSKLVSQLRGLYLCASAKHFAGLADDVLAFASKTIPGLLKRQTNGYQPIVAEVTDTLKRVVGAHEALAFLIERIEQAPAWVRSDSQADLNQGETLAELRAAVCDTELDARLLKIVLAELRRDLKSGVGYYGERSMYDHRCDHFWAREDDYRKVAEEVYAQRRNSGAAVVYIADYLYQGLGQYDRAIEMLFVANKEKLLDEAAQWQLAQRLKERSREGESIDLLQGMVQQWPDDMEYRVALMEAYFDTKRHEELRGLLDQTDKHFHKDGSWTEDAPLPELAKECLDVELYEQAVKYYKELIPLYQRTTPNRGIGDGKLSEYYQELASAYSGLGKTFDAVDAACGAIVSWGASYRERASAIDRLKNVIGSEAKLDDLVAQLDRQAQERGMDNPIVRKAVGEAYQEKGDRAKAIVQLRLACEMQPDDKEIHEHLIACFDVEEDKEGAIRQILELLQLTPRDIELYADLGMRYEELGRPKDTERARTSIVAVLPAESESHAMLARIRQGQDRWPEAEVQWEQVARIRALEPTGLLELGDAQAHLGQWDQLAQTIGKLRAKTWPPRFSDVGQQIGGLQRQLDAGRKEIKSTPK
jgi:tetratricopeptide (TPR) repeat protein